MNFSNPIRRSFPLVKYNPLPPSLPEMLILPYTVTGSIFVVFSQEIFISCSKD